MGQELSKVVRKGERIREVMSFKKGGANKLQNKYVGIMAFFSGVIDEVITSTFPFAYGCVIIRNL